jgi:hypothetical protein
LANGIVVFLGPSLDRATAESLLVADYRPPARRGDIYRCLCEPIDAIALVDGVFHGEPAVWQREILEALDEGIAVFGASSMGALRAAELHYYGMRGVGTVFDWYRSGAIDGDDEVALLFGDADSGYRALSEPLVNLRATLEAAHRADVLTRGESDLLLRHAQSLHYPARSFAALTGAVAGALLGEARAGAWRAFVAQKRVDLKRDDARLLLSQLSSTGARRAAARAIDRPRYADRLAQRRVVVGATERSGAELLAAVAEPDARARFAPHLHRRWFVTRWARERGLGCPPPARQAFAEAFAGRHAIADLDAWLSARAVSRNEYSRFVDEEALFSWVCGQEPARFGLSPVAGRPEAPFLADWAERHGLHAPSGQAVWDWLVERGPGHFGFRFATDALVAELALLTVGASQLLTERS